MCGIVDLRSARNLRNARLRFIVTAANIRHHLRIYLEWALSLSHAIEHIGMLARLAFVIGYQIAG